MNKDISGRTVTLGSVIPLADVTLGSVIPLADVTLGSVTYYIHRGLPTRGVEQPLHFSGKALEKP